MQRRFPLAAALVSLLRDFRAAVMGGVATAPGGPPAGLPPSRKEAALAASLVTLLLAGCQTTPPSLGTYESSAVQVAVQRGQFDMVCQGATGTVVSRTLLQPQMWGGGEDAEYVVRVEGCGQRRNYSVVCGTHDPSGRTSAGQMTWVQANTVSCLAASGGG